MKLIAYDGVKYGSSAERRRLLAKWDAEVKSLPKYAATDRRTHVQ